MVRYSTPELEPALMVCRPTSPRRRHYHKASICTVSGKPASTCISINRFSTLQAIADHGSEAFYTGPIGKPLSPNTIHT